MNKNFIKIISGLAVVLGLTACDETSVNETVISAPVIQSFSPAEGYGGSEVLVSGNALNNVVKAYVGDVEADIVQRISDSRIIIRVPATAKSGEITLENSTGSGKSADKFLMSYPSPEIDTTTLPESVEVSSRMLIFGKRMSVINRVLFMAEGYDPHEAQVLSKNDNEIVVQVPYVEADDAKMLFEYFDGSVHTTGGAPVIAMKLARFQPIVKEVSAEQATIGDVITLTGEYLDKVNYVTLDGENCMITVQTPETLKFVVPELDSFVDGENTSVLEIVYSDGAEKNILNGEFKVHVPLILFWEDRKIWAQGRDVEEFTSFFSPETGIAYANSMWRELDAVSYRYQDATCSANQTPAVSQTEYDSVLPYFFFTGVSAGNLQLNSPAGSASMLKNIFTENNS